MLSLYMVIKNNYYISWGDLETSLKKDYASKYPLIYDYKTVKLGRISFAKLEIMDVKKLSATRINTNSESLKLQEIIKKAKEYTYNEQQPNAELLASAGGNCQAFAVYVKYMCDKNDLESTIAYTDSHMYNIINIDSKEYKVDVIFNIIEEVT